MSKQSLSNFLLPSILFLMLLSLSVMGCDLTEREYYVVLDLDFAEEQGEKVIISELRDEHLVRRTVAERVERYYTDKKLKAFEVEIYDYNAQGELEMTLTADMMIIDEVNDTYTASGNVVIIRTDDTLYTELLSWDQRTDEIYSPEDVTFIRGDNVLQGIGLRTDSHFRSVYLRQVTAEGRLDEDDFNF